MTMADVREGTMMRERAVDGRAAPHVPARPVPRSPVSTLMSQVQAEYDEMPGLSVTLPQAQRLWAVDRPTCEEAFRHLIASGVLRKTTRGRFVRS
jgi:hypothetical protein